MQSGERIVINGRDYRLGPVLSTGAGSYGQVWAATDSAGRPVALKFINTEAMSQADASLHGHWRAHLEREIAFLAGLDSARSRHVVTLIDHGQIDDQPVLVMERLQANLGQWLTQRRRDGESPLDLACILDWTEQILDGLDVIHGAGFVYRDLKFSNILVGDHGLLLKLADFGSLKRENGDSTRSCIGTPATMAPEQILPIGHSADGCEYAVDYRADFYALGLLLFALLTERPTTAAQRRLGQLLALHGQEGAGQHRDQLGGLTDEERELLRRSIEFWTVPVRPEQEQHGAALLLSGLLGRLLARDPAARPATSAEIRAVLDAVRADQPAVPFVSPNGLAPPPDTPPNRHPRRANSSVGSTWSRRAAGLAGVLGLAGALAWAVVIQPILRHDRTEPTATLLASPSSDLATQPPPVTAPAAPMNAPKIAAEPPATEPASAPEPSADNVSANATAQPAETTEPGPPAESPAATPTETTAKTEPPAAPTTEPIAKPEAKSTAGALELADSPRETDPAEQPAATAPPAVDDATPHKSSAPAVVERSTPARVTKKPPREKTAKAAPPTAVTAAKSAKAASSVATPVTVPAPVVPPKAPPVAKSAPKPPAPTATIARSAPPAKKTLSSAPRTNSPSGRLAHTSTAPKAAASPTPAPRTARPAPRPAALPPIQLVSNNLGGSKATSSPSTQPPIELVSRSNLVSATTSVRPAQSARATTAVPSRNSATPPTPPVRSADPITAFQKNAGRATTDIRREAENIGNWMSRTSASVGTEIQRGLDSANRAVNNWAGNCPGANGCQPARRVERRDRWSSRYSKSAASRSQQPVSPADTAPSEFPPRRPQEYR
ncbi:MAG TPA: protein kinase [Candidatus Competibacter sp.]|nr:protein kinase [Candidatus Competibacter sp.]